MTLQSSAVAMKTCTAPTTRRFLTAIRSRRERIRWRESSEASSGSPPTVTLWNNTFSIACSASNPFSSIREEAGQ